MSILRALALFLVPVFTSLPAYGMECPNCALEFPSSWKAQEQPWGTRVWVEDQQVDIKVQPEESLEPLGPGDVEDELVWLAAELESEGRVITHENGRIVRTASREPAVVLDFAWSDPQGGEGRGVRLVRRCGVRLIIEQRADEIRLDALLTASDRVRYTRSECVSLNADVIPLEVLEGIDNVQLPEVTRVVPRPVPVSDPTATAPSDQADPAAGASEPSEGSTDASESSGSPLTTLLLVLGLVLLMGLVVLVLRGGRSDPLEGLPPLDPPPRERGDPPARGDDPPGRGDDPPARHTDPGPVGAGPMGGLASQERVRAEADRPRPSEGFDLEHPPADDFGDEDTDAILPAGTYGLRGAGGGDRSEQVSVAESDELDARQDASEPAPEMVVHAVPASEPPRSVPRSSSVDSDRISVPSHAVVSYPSVVRGQARGIEVGDAPSYEHDDLVRVSPLESVIASLGITTWLDFTAPGISGVSYLPSGIAELLEIQNGGRFGYGWLLLLGLRRKNMDLMTINGESRVKTRFGEGWLVGVFAFGNALWVNPDQSWEIQTLEGERHFVGESAEAALRRLAEDTALRDLGARHELVERCRSAVGELLPGWVYRYHGESNDGAGQGFEPVEIVPYMELLG